MEEFILIAGVVLSIVRLDLLFLLCSNVAQIKKSLRNDNVWIATQNFNKAKAFGDNEEARACLKQVIWLEILDTNKKSYDKTHRMTIYEKIETKYASSLEEFQLAFPSKDVCAKA